MFTGFALLLAVLTSASGECKSGFSDSSSSIYFQRNEVFSHAIDRAPLVISQHRLPLVIQPIEYETQSLTGVEIDLKEFSALAFSAISPAAESALTERLKTTLTIDIEVIVQPKDRVLIRSLSASHFHPPIKDSKAKITITADANREVILKETLHFLFWRNRQNRQSLISIADLEAGESSIIGRLKFFTGDSPNRIFTALRGEAIHLEKNTQILGEEIDIARFLLNRADQLKFTFLEPSILAKRFQENLEKLPSELVLTRKQIATISEINQTFTKEEQKRNQDAIENLLHTVLLTEEKLQLSEGWLKKIKIRYRL